MGHCPCNASANIWIFHDDVLRHHAQIQMHEDGGAYKYAELGGSIRLMVITEKTKQFPLNKKLSQGSQQARKRQSKGREDGQSRQREEEL